VQPVNYLICSDGNDFGRQLLNEITSAGNKAVIVNSESEYMDYLKSVTEKENPDEVIFLTNSESNHGNKFSTVPVNYLLTVLQNLNGASDLNIVTKNSQYVVSGDSADGFADSPFNGFGKVIAIEHPELSCRRIDTDKTDESNAKLIVNEIKSSDSKAEGEIAYRNGQRFVSRLKRAALKPGNNVDVNGNGTYLITGGTKGLGLLFAKYLADKGAKHLALISRSDVQDESVKDLEKLRSQGVNVNVFKADITDTNEISKIIDEISNSGYPLKGIIQSAGVLEDGVISNQTGEKFEKYSILRFAEHLISVNLQKISDLISL
jgi:hypothetical protein